MSILQTPGAGQSVREHRTEHLRKVPRQGEKSVAHSLALVGFHRHFLKCRRILVEPVGRATQQRVDWRGIVGPEQVISIEIRELHQLGKALSCPTDRPFVPPYLSPNGVTNRTPMASVSRVGRTPCWSYSSRFLRATTKKGTEEQERTEPAPAQMAAARKLASLTGP